MGNANLVGTKRRIVSVSSTKKITNAMKLVATSKLKNYKSMLGDSSRYVEELGNLLSTAFANPDSLIDNEYVIKTTSKKKLVVVVTSSLGLCAGYNYNIYRLVSEQCSPNDELIIIGKKGNAHFAGQDYCLNTTFVDCLHAFDYAEVRKISRYIIKQYLTGQYAGVEVIYTKYVNSLVFKTEILPIFPFSFVANSTQKLSTVILEPSPREIIANAVPLYVRSALYQSLINSLVSEFASRRNAMENATTNAEDIVSQLMIDYNKARQSSITQEITEVVSGANALK